MNYRVFGLPKLRARLRRRKTALRPVATTETTSTTAHAICQPEFPRWRMLTNSTTIETLKRGIDAQRSAGCTNSARPNSHVLTPQQYRLGLVAQRIHRPRYSPVFWAASA
jgi:hypothetical protein